jgi:hypothetical protein
MLDGLSALTSWSRRHARRSLAGALAGRRPTRVPVARPVVYGPDVVAALRKVWATLRASAASGWLPHGRDRGGDAAAG